ncbi:MAG: aldo/keto reductase [Solobacterium sp.]|nr:aldo/keto reductase [Solobacterium sp.]
MKYQTLGQTPIRASRICLGGMSFGKHFDDFYQWTLNEKETCDMIAHAWDLGVNFIDTANQYSHGTSEEYIGKALKKLDIPRDQIVLATKVYYNEGHLSPAAIRREIEGSLERLGTDYVDLYMIHRYDYDTPPEEFMETLDSLVKEGKVRALAASSMYAYQFHMLQNMAEKKGWTPFSVMQNHYNLLYREDERELIPVCEMFGVSRISYSPLAGGHLSRPEWDSRSVRSQTDNVLRRRYDAAKENDLRVLAHVQDIAQARGITMAQTALAWQYARGVTAPVVGATSAKHFDEAVQAMDIELNADEIRYLEEPYVPHELKGPLPRPEGRPF